MATARQRCVSAFKIYFYDLLAQYTNTILLSVRAMSRNFHRAATDALSKRHFNAAQVKHTVTALDVA